jgi:hypothetical protein
MELCMSPGREKGKGGEPGQIGNLRMEDVEKPEMEVPGVAHHPATQAHQTEGRALQCLPSSPLRLLLLPSRQQLRVEEENTP